MLVTIYALRDPRSGLVRYVGKTASPVWTRVRAHLYRAHRAGRAHSSRWLRGLLLEGILPCIEVLEVVPDGGDWVARERHWIAYYRERGARLTNLTDGGKGSAGRVVGAEERAMRAARWTPEQRERMRQRKLGVRSTPEAVARRVRALRAPEVSARHGATMRRRWAEGAYASRRPRPRPSMERVARFLDEVLAGGPLDSREVALRATARGIGSAALKRGSRVRGVVKTTKSYGKPRGLVSTWSLPEGDPVVL